MIYDLSILTINFMAKNFFQKSQQIPNGQNLFPQRLTLQNVQEEVNAGHVKTSP